MFLKIRKRSSQCGFDWEGNPEKEWGNGKEYPWAAESGICVLVCLRKKKLLETAVIILKYIRNVYLSYLKIDFKIAELLPKDPFFVL